MTEQEHTLIKTEWGLHLVLNPSVITNDDNLLGRVEFVINTCKGIGKKRILVETFGATRNLSLTKLIESVELVRKIDGTGYRIAFVAPHLVKEEFSRFVDNVGFNRAIFIQFFYDKDTALEWLLK
jgi:hypothetical protein